MNKLDKFFDKVEDKIRGALSRYPLLYATVAGIAVVSFWRGVWETSDLIGIPPVASLLGGFTVLLLVGILVTEFIGNRIIISGLRGEKKLEEKTLEEIEEEEKFLHELKKKVDRMEKMIDEIYSQM